MKLFSSSLVPLFLIMALALALAQPATAAEGRFYFVATTAPLGSITAGGQNARGVYLRWDLLDGALPADLERIRLVRRVAGAAPGAGTELLNVTAAQVMSQAEIAGLYQGTENARRLQETVLRLRELIAGEGGSFSAGAFAAEIAAALGRPGWGYFTSQYDFNIARARYRAYLDQPPPGNYEYELIAVSDSASGNLEQRLGLVQISSTATLQLLGAQSDSFRQTMVTQFRCDLPESGKDHYTVALTWGAPGANSPSDALASQAYLSGFDLYRTSDNLPASTVLADVELDIAALATTADFDERGAPILPGLEKVNASVINEPGGSASAPKWLETSADLRAANLKPGDRRAYYLVARDFTGNYGPTETAIVVVPNLVRPVTPGPLRPFVDETSLQLRGSLGASATLTWDEPNLDNYLNAYGSTRRICNQIDAASSGVLEFVGINEDCAVDPRRSVRVDARDYLVYRFPDFASAEAFKDSDGDGYEDDQEAVENRCIPGPELANASSYLVYASPNAGVDVALQTVELPSGREVVLFQDRVPAGQKDTVFWYRVAARTPDGQLSFLSPPQRAIFPDRDLPEPPVVSLSRPERVPNGCALIKQGPSAEFQLTDNLDAAPFTVTCPSGGGAAFSEKDSLKQSCANLAQVSCSEPLVLTYPGGNSVGPENCSIPVDQDFCGEYAFSLEPTFGEGQVPVLDGEVVAGPLLVTFETIEPETCVSVHVNVNDDLVRISETCEPRGTVEIAAGSVCGYAVAHDANNNVSPASALPCVLVLEDLKPPGPPQLLDFRVSDSEARFRWRLPPEPIAATLGELDWEPPEGGVQRALLSLSATPAEDDQPLADSSPVDALVGSADRWCLRLRSVAPNRKGESSLLSDWSPRRCYTRRSDDDSPPSYLPWPAVPGPEPRPAATAEVLQVFGALPVLAIELAEVAGLSRQCRIAADLGLTGFPPLPDVECTDVGRTLAQVVLDPAVGFLVYRQRRDQAGVIGDWIQVAPLIEFAHWDALEIPDSPFKSPLTSRLNDPYIELQPEGTQAETWQFRFIDRYPYELLAPGNATEYRYQLIYFDDAHRPVGRSLTNWVGAGS